MRIAFHLFLALESKVVYVSVFYCRYSSDQMVYFWFITEMSIRWLVGWLLNNKLR